MKNILGLLFCLSICLSIISCSCLSVDCPDGDDTTIYIRILSAVDSTDLLFGDDKIYNVENLKIYDLDTADSTLYPIVTLGGDLYNDSLLTFDHIDFMVSRIFIDFGNTDIDTLDMNFQTIDSECCDDITSVSTLNHNGTQIYNITTGLGSSILQLLK